MIERGSPLNPDTGINEVLAQKAERIGAAVTERLQSFYLDGGKGLRIENLTDENLVALFALLNDVKDMMDGPAESNRAISREVNIQAIVETVSSMADLLSGYLITDEVVERLAEVKALATRIRNEKYGG